MIRYSSPDKYALKAFCDASFAPEISYLQDAPGDVEKFGYSRSGCAVFCYGNLIDWSTTQQSIIATSSTSAEVIAVCENLDSILIPREICLQIFGDKRPVVVFKDNQSASQMLTGCQHRRMRHAMIKAAAVTESIRRELIVMQEVSGKHQVADALTKALPVDRFLALRIYLVQRSIDLEAKPERN